MNELLEFLSIIWEAFTSVLSQYGLWILLILAVVGFAYFLFQVIVGSFQGPPKRAVKSGLATIEKIANLTAGEREELRGKNQPEVVERLVREAKWTLREARALEQNPKPTSEAALREMKKIQQQIEMNLVVLPERFAAILRGRQFSQFDADKKIR